MDLNATIQRLARADFLDALGIAIGAHEVSLVHVTKRFTRVSLVHARVLSLPEAGRERIDAVGMALTEFVHDFEIAPDQVVLCLPRHVACVSRLLVPETARGSLPQVLDYELERLLPFPKEDLYCDSLTYDMGGEEKRLGVVVFGVPRRLVDEYLEVLAQAHIRPQMVTLTSSALVGTLSFCGSSTETPCVLVVPENGTVELNFIEKKHLVASHSFPLGSGARELQELITQGVARNLPGTSPTEVPLFACVASDTFPFVVNAEHDLYALVLAQFPLVDGEILPPAALPALGAALHGAGEVNSGINLLPQEQRAQREKRLSPFTLVLVGVVFLLGLLWATSVVIQEKRVLWELARQKDMLDPTVHQVQSQENEIAQLQKRLQALDEVTKKRVVPVLTNLSELLPQEFYLTHFRYKDGDIEVSGIGSKPASDLVATLEGSACLRNVAPKGPFTKTPQGETFTLGAQEEPCNGD